MPAKKPSKLAVVVNQKPPEHKFVVPGFGKFPRSVKATAYLPMPFPGQFQLALTGNPKLPEPAPKSFTESWRDFWLSVSEGFSEDDRTKCSAFFKSDGLRALGELTERGCNPNFAMSLFSSYFWDEKNREHERDDPNVQSHQSDLKAVQTVRRLVRNHTWEATPETVVLQTALEGLEKIVRSYIEESDFSSGQHVQNDKENRVIYALYHHLLQNTPGRGPHWQLMLDLLLAAGAISRDVRPRRKRAAILIDGELVEDPPTDSPKSRIKPRIKTFERDHPKEASLMPRWVSTWPAHFSV
jgi:hypothetical protein